MDAEQQGEHKPVRSRITARPSALKPNEYAKALEHFGVAKRRHAAHIGRHETTVDRWCRGVEGPIPLVVEWVLMLYHYQPWTRRVRGRLRLPLKQWGINRDDKDPAARSEEELMRAAVSDEDE